MYRHMAEVYDVIFEDDPTLQPLIKGYIHMGGQAIDLGCGTGRLTRIIHDLGMCVLGIDLDETMIEVARKHHPHVMFEVKDMLQAFDCETYDLITCFGNTLPHINETSLNTFFFLVSKHLSSRGFCLIQMLHYDRILRLTPTSLPVIEKQGIRFERHYDYIEDHIDFTTVIIDQGQRRESTHPLFPHRIETLRMLAENHGLMSAFYGENTQDPLTDESPYFTMIVTNPSR